MSAPLGILCVDDEAPIVEYLALMLKREGYSVETCDGGWEAFEKIKERRFDFVLSDVRMVKGDGIELLENVQGLEVRPPVGLLSAFTDVSTSDIFDRGAVAFLQKPIVWSTVSDTIRRAVKPRPERWAGEPALGPTLSATWSSWAEAKQRGELALGAGGFFFALKSGHPPVDSVVRFDLGFGAGSPGRLTGAAFVRWARGTTRHGFHPGVGLEILTLATPGLAFVLDEIARSTPKAFVPIGYGRPFDHGP